MKEDLYDDLYLEEKEEKTLVSGMYPAVHGGSLALFVLHSIGVQHLGIRHHQGQ